jgi:predicted O-methyltransferase YrrM
VEYPNWFTKGRADVYFARNLTPYAGQPLKVLQLGAYTGDSTEWLFENILTNPDSVLYDVDTWEGSDEPAHKELDWKSVEEVYLSRHQEKIDSGRIIRFKGTTDNFFSSELGMQQFHFIYVDADHKASSVLRDGLNAIYRVPSGGIVAFDDYLWTQGKGQHLDPKPAVDAIWHCYADQLDVLDTGVQVWFRKK